MLTVIKGNKKERPNPTAIHLIHLTCYAKSLLKYDATKRREDLYKVVYHGMRSVNATRKNKDLIEAYALFEFIEYVRYHISELTPLEFMGIFPIEKTYDGERYCSKDYFSTIKALEKYNIDEPIGDNFDDLMWDYMNNDVREFFAQMLSVIGDIQRAENGKGLMEQFCEENGIDTYTVSTDQTTGRQYMTSNTTGEVTPVKKPVPKHLKIIETEVMT